MTFELRRLHLQPARHAGPRGLHRGHLPHADRGRLGGHGASTPPRASRRRPASCSRSAACATCRSSPSSTSWTARAAIRSSCSTRSSRPRSSTSRRRAGRSAWAATSAAATTCCSDRLLLFERGKGATADRRASLSAASTTRSSTQLLPARRGREAARGGRDGARRSARRSTVEAYREGHLTPVFFGSALQQLRRARAARRRLAELAPPPRPQPAANALVEPTEEQGHRLRVQDPGEHGPQAPRPHRLRAALLGPLRARHEAAPRAHGQAHRRAQPGALPRPRARARRGGLAGRHHRHPQPRRRCASATR